MVVRRCLLFVSVSLALLFVSFGSHALPDIQTWESHNGAKVLFVENTNLPMVDIRIVFDAGSARDEGLDGVAALTNGLLSEGAKGKSAQALAESFESVGAILNYESLRDMAYVGVRSLTSEEYLEEAIRSLALVVSQPDFPEEAFQRELARMKVSVEASKQSPGSIAGEAFYKAMYGGHPYASPPGGTLESLNKITLESVKQFYKKYYVAKNAVIAIVGNVDRWQAEKLVKKIVYWLPIGEKAKALPEVPKLNRSQLVRIEFPSKQSHIFVGQPGMKRGDDDYFTLYLANHPFGGSGFASRLMKVIREDRGLAYSVYSYFSPMRENGPFSMGLQTRVDQTDEAIGLIKKELVRYIKEGPDADELESSLSNIIGGFPLNLDSNSKLLGYLAMIGFYDMPITYLNDFVANMKGVTAEKIKLALARRLKPDTMVTVIVGSGK